MMCEVLRKVFVCSLNSAEVERSFSELSQIVTVDKTALKDSSITQKAIIAASARRKARVSRESRGEAGIPSKTQKRVVDNGGMLKCLRSIDSGKKATADGEPDVIEVLAPNTAAAAGGAQAQVALNAGSPLEGEEDLVRDISGDKPGNVLPQLARRRSA